MRIALVSPFDPLPPDHDGKGAHLGGVERVFAELATRLARRGHNVTLVCSTDGKPVTTIDDGLQVVRRRRFGTLARAPLADLAAAIPRDAQLVHVAATYPFTTGPALRQARRLGAKAVLDFHFEPSPPWPHERLAASVHARRMRGLYAQADAVLVRSFAYAASAPSLALVKKDRLHTVPNGFDPARFTPEGPAQGDVGLLFVGRLVPYKGLDVLLEALDRASLRIPLTLVGDGPQRRPLQRQAKRLGLPVRFVGHVPDEDLAAYYRGARLTVLPSRNGQEAFGMVLVESMACGTPVLASSLPGVADVARQGGWLCPPDDPDTLAHRLAQVLDEPVRLDRRALSRRVQGLYGWDAVVDRLEQVYDGLSDDQGPQPEALADAHPRRDPVL